jgi:hypothetical protein
MLRVPNSHKINNIAISKIVKYRKDYPQTGEDMNV